MGLRFNPPPGWPPAPEGFVPPPGWQPDPAWPPPPPGWLLWIPDGDAGDPQVPTGSLGAGPAPEVQRVPWQPPYGQPAASPQAPYGQPAWPGQPPSGDPYSAQPGAGRTSGFAIASLILGLLGFLLVTAVLSVIFGIVALVKIRGGQLRGKGLAVAGIILSGLWCLLIAALIVIGIAVSPQRSTATGHITGKGTSDVFSLRAGDCFQNPRATAALLGVSDVTVVPCTQPHNAQVFVEFPAAGGTYPGSAALRRQADQGCRARIAGNVDRSKITGSMSLHYLYPEPGSWTDGHRAITCLIVDSSADMTSSLLLSRPAG